MKTAIIAVLFLFAAASIGCQKELSEQTPTTTNPRYVDTVKPHFSFEISPKDSVKTLVLTGHSRAIWIQFLPYWEIWNESCSMAVYQDYPVDANGQLLPNVKPGFLITWINQFWGFSYNYIANKPLYFVQYNRSTKDPSAERWVIRVFKDGY
jgi:hypothetical protein